MARKSEIESWTKIRSIARRPLVAVIGSDPYFDGRIRSWWCKAHRGSRFVELPSSTKDMNRKLRDILAPSLLSNPQNLIFPELPESSNPCDMMGEFWDREHRVLMYLGKSRDRLSEEDLAWFKRRSSIRMGLIVLDVRGRFDRRKIGWGTEIAQDLGLNLEERSILYMLDWADWDLGRFENELIKLGLDLEDKSQFVGVNYLEQEWPFDLNKQRDIDKLAGRDLAHYFRALDAAYQDAPSAADRKRTLNRHLRIVEQMRILLVVNPEGDLEFQSEKLRKFVRFPMSEWQLRRFLERTLLSKTDAIRFLAQSAEWIRKSFLRKA